MKKMITAGVCGLAVFVLAALSATRSQAAPDGAPTWSTRPPAASVERRSAWWAPWPNAARDHGTFCVSCHTAAPYALARPALRKVLGETGPSAPEIALFSNVTKRVMQWKDVE